MRISQGRIVFYVMSLIVWVGLDSLDRDARADLIIPTSGGVILLDGTNQEDVAVGVDIDPGNLALSFFGNQVNRIYVSENGNLNFNGDGSFFPDPLGNPSIARIAPLWDDFLLLQNSSGTVNNRVVLQSVNGAYLAVTWQNVRLFNETVAGSAFPSTSRSAQVLLFASDQLIRGFQFRQHDIVFAYVGHVAGTSDFGGVFATVGLDSGTGAFTPLPGTIDGTITPSEAGLLAWEDGSFVLFRPDNTQASYTSSIQIFAVPEPSSVIMLVIATITVLFRRREQ